MRKKIKGKQVYIKKAQANQFTVDPRQAQFIANYCDPKSETFANATQSAIKAGYSQQYAEVILNQSKWLSQSLSGAIYPQILKQSTNNLVKFTSDNYQKSDKIKLDATKFSLMALNKEVFGAKVQVNSTNTNLSVIEATIRNISEGTQPSSEAKESVVECEVVEISP
jgi:phage terminase small subunit